MCYTYDQGLEVVGVAYYSVWSRFIADQAEHPIRTMMSLKIETVI